MHSPGKCSLDEESLLSFQTGGFRGMSDADVFPIQPLHSSKNLDLAASIHQNLAVLFASKLWLDEKVP